MERSDVEALTFEDVAQSLGFNTDTAGCWSKGVCELMVICFRHGGLYVFDREVLQLRAELEKYKTALSEAETRLSIAQKVISQKNAAYKSGGNK